MKKFFFVLLGLIFFVSAGILLFLQHPKFGRTPQGDYLDKIKKSPHYSDGEFRNFEPLPVQRQSGNRLVNWINVFYNKKERGMPQNAVPSVKTDFNELPDDQDVVVWLGHSSYFIKLGGKNFLVDPVFSDYASPFFLFNKAFTGANPYTAKDMPEIDYLLITHDHWDHLDYATITALTDKVKNVVCPLGVGGYLEQWGYRKDIIQEGDWFDKLSPEDDLKIYFLPSRHYSARLLTRNKTLWTAFALITPGKRVFLSGDGGYGAHFKNIGGRFEAFDIVLLDMGQYNDNWYYVHMNPENAAQAAADLHTKALLPVHVGKFSMAYHAWDDPFERIKKASQNKDYRLLTPMLGEVVKIGDKEQTFTEWWRRIE